MYPVNLYVPNPTNETINLEFDLINNSHLKDSYGTKNMANRLGLIGTKDPNVFKFVPYYSWLYGNVDMETYLHNNV